MNGVVVVDKPEGKTSFDIVRDIRRVLKIKKVGHTGTLDPLATGVLPVCVNEATKLVPFLLRKDKQYRVTMLLGVETDTQDSDGTVVARCVPRVTPHEVEEVVRRHVGKMEQTPPKYSAVKFRGKPLYKWTREGVDIDPPPRMIEVYDITIEDISLPYVTCAVSCSKGTYVRTLCADIGKLLGCGACVVALRRTESGNFPETIAVSLRGYDDEEKRKILEQNLISLSDVLPEAVAVVVDERVAEKIRQGYQPAIEVFERNDIPSLSRGDLIKFLTVDDKMVAIARMLYDTGELSCQNKKARGVKVLRVFNE